MANNPSSTFGKIKENILSVVKVSVSFIAGTAIGLLTAAFILALVMEIHNGITGGMTGGVSVYTLCGLILYFIFPCVGFIASLGLGFFAGLEVGDGVYDAMKKP